LRISEKRYKAEQESLKLIAILDKKKEHIRDIEIKMRALKAENAELKTKNTELEEEVKELAEGKPRASKTVNKATFGRSSPTGGDGESP
jgi:cell division protein FtsB